MNVAIQKNKTFKKNYDDNNFLKKIFFIFAENYVNKIFLKNLTNFEINNVF